MKIARMLGAAAMPVLMAGSSVAQTRISLWTQARSVDSSQAPATCANPTGTVLPATCQTGECYCNLDDEPGNDLCGCTSTNAWTRLGKPANLKAGVGSTILRAATVAVDDAADRSYSTGTGPPTHPCEMGQQFCAVTLSGQIYHSKSPKIWQPVGRSSTLPVAPAITSTGGTIYFLTCLLSTRSILNSAWLTTLDAGKINSGTVAAARLPATAARTEQSNAFAAGKKEVIQPRASSAGIRAAARALPSAAAAGDLAVDSVDKTLTRYDGSAWQAAGGGRWGSFDYDPATAILQVEDFIGGTTTSEQIGAWGLTATKRTSKMSPKNSGTYRTCRIVTGTTTATSGHTARIRRVDGSTIGFTLNGGAEQTVTTNIQSSGCNIFLNVNNGAATASKTHEADYVWMKVTGISR